MKELFPSLCNLGESGYHLGAGHVPGVRKAEGGIIDKGIKETGMTECRGFEVHSFGNEFVKREGGIHNRTITRLD